MLSQLSATQCEPVPMTPLPDNRWSRDQKEDMKTAIDLLYKFKQDLDKLHPECTNIIEKMLQIYPYNRF